MTSLPYSRRFPLLSMLLVLPLLPLPYLHSDPPGGAAKAPPAEYECRWARTAIAIDGKGGEAVWKQAQLIDYFYLPWLKTPRAARTATQARLLWDREYLYFLADMEDSDLYADVKEQDGMTWNNDVFELFFRPAENKPGYYEFQISAAGTRMDMFLPRRGAGGYARFKSDGDFHIDAQVQRRGSLNNWRDRDTGWTVEGRIPWSDFRPTGGRPEADEHWRFALCRYDYSVAFEGPELSTCAPLSSQPQPDFHHFEDYAKLRFVGPPAQGSGEAGTRPSGSGPAPAGLEGCRSRTSRQRLENPLISK